MSEILQVCIGLAPVLLVSLVLLVARKQKLLPILFTVVTVAAVGTTIFTSAKSETKKVYEKKVVSAGDYLYLAEHSMSKGDFTEAREYLDRMYKELGDTPEGTLATARLEALTGDYQGAKILYSKVESTDKGKELLSEADKELAKDVDDGVAFSVQEAASELAKIDLYTSNGGKAEDIGYDSTKVESLKIAASGSKDYSDSIKEAIKSDMEKVEDENEERYENLSDAIKLADKVEEAYDKIQNGEGTDVTKEEIAGARRDLQKIFESDDSIFAIDKIDVAFIKALATDGRLKELVEYASKTDSAEALIAIAQEYIKGNLEDKDFPADFVKLTKEEHKKVSEACRKALDKILEDESLEGEDLASIKDMYEYIKKMQDSAILTEIITRIQPENEPIENQSKIYLGSSTIDYATGNESGGDEKLNNAINTYMYSNDDKYVDSLNNINKVINNTANSDEVKNVGQYFKDAYDSAVITVNPRDKKDDIDTKGDKDDKDEDHKGGNGFLDNDNGFEDEDEDVAPPKEEKPKDPEEKPDPAEALAQSGSNFVSKKLAMINISKIDTSEFPKIKVNIQTGEKLDLKNLQLALTDCDINIDDFEIKKVDYDSAKIFVVCDNSGSMSGSIEDLKASVKSFVSTISKKEKVDIIAFSSSVLFSSGLTDSASTLEEYIAKFNAGGGTNVASGVFHALDEASGSSDSFNVIMVMTDGADSSFSQSTLDDLRNKCQANNVVLYTLGLGSAVHPDYLKNVAYYGGGSFVYASDAVALESLYRFIHKQMENNYEITFTAIDTVSHYRKLGIVNHADNSSTEREYQYGTGTDENNENGDFDSTDGSVHINGLDTKLLYKTDSDVTVKVSGSGFTKDSKCSVSIKSDSFRGTYSGVYSSENYFNVVIPKEVPVGEYKVTIVVDGKAVSDTLEVLVLGQTSTLKYGAYNFEAQSIVKNGDTITLSGAVTLNGYIHFKGSITLNGKIPESFINGNGIEGPDEEVSEKITLSDQAGSYISYPSTSDNLIAKLTSNVLNIPALGNLTLYDDKRHYNSLDEYNVEKLVISDIRYGGLAYQGPSIALYPHKISIVLGKMGTDLPLMDELMKYSGNNPFMKFEATGEAIINGSGLYAKGKAGISDASDTISFAAFPIGLDEVSLDFDTFKNDYKFKLMLKTSSTKLVPGFAAADSDGSKSSGYGFDFGIKGGNWDSFTLYADIPIVIPDTPVSLSGFFVGVEDMAAVDQDGCFAKKLFQTTFLGGCDISVAKLTDYVPAAEPFVGDLAFVTFAETTTKVNVLEFKYSVESTIKLLGLFECGKTEYKLGKYDYSDYLLDIPEKEVTGMYISLTQGPKIEFANFKFQCQGQSEIIINNKTFGYKSTGILNAEINFLGNHKADGEGNFELALVDFDKFYLVVRVRSMAADADAGFKICLDGWDSYVKLY